MAQPVLGGEGDVVARWGREMTGKKTTGVAAMFGLRKKGTLWGLVSYVSGWRRCLGREGERRLEEGRDLLAFGAKITKQGPTAGRGRGRCWFCFQREGSFLLGSGKKGREGDFVREIEAYVFWRWGKNGPVVGLLGGLMVRLKAIHGHCEWKRKGTEWRWQGRMGGDSGTSQDREEEDGERTGS
ncbi:hypothetical protein H0E87_007391 [Populus deltoides]|uniref:Uncharacterized protein n=1 Tax=Populus deltoides TaxID=3696 RepID=A0A8T2ZB87_POPDE|nr:hypothetical protein H0E87_007391 [Populus deltoides]